MTARTFRRWVVRYEAAGPAGLRDRQVSGPSHLRAPPEEVAALEALYRDGCEGWNVRHFHEEVYVGEHGGSRSDTWVKNRLQEAGLVRKGRRTGPHRERRDRKPAAGMMLHQDASTHEWVPGSWWDLVVTMDDATGEVCSGFRGLPLLAHAEGGRKGGRSRPTQFGRAMADLHIEMIAAYSPQASGRSERLFGTLQGRLPQELARAGITEMDADPEAAAPVPLRPGQGPGPRVRGRNHGGVPPRPEAGRLRRERAASTVRRASSRPSHGLGTRSRRWLAAKK